MALEMDLTARKRQLVRKTTSILLGCEYFIYQGTPPVNADAYDSVASTSDLLVMFTDSSLSETIIGLPDNGDFTTTSVTAPTATGTGTATWFAAVHQTYPDIVMTGTVGSTGSGADFELISTSLVNGNQVDFGSFEHSVS